MMLPKRRFALITLPLLVVMCPSSAVDRTLEPGADGPEVTEAVISRLNRIFGDDNDFVRNTACMLSHKRSDFKRNKGNEGNIWQISDNLLELTRDFIKFPNLESRIEPLYRTISKHFPIYWKDPSNVTKADMNKQMYSGLAARLLLASEDLRHHDHFDPSGHEAHYWEKFYNLTFLPEELKQLRKNCKVQSCSARMNMCIMLDRSGSIEEADYKLSLDFIHDLVEHTKKQKVRTAFLVFSENVTLVSTFSATAEELQKAIKDRSKTLSPEGKTCTGSAILHCVDAFRSSHLPTQGAPKITLLLTDGESSNNCPDKLDKALDQARLAKINNWAIAIGPAAKCVEQTADPKKEECDSSAGDEINWIAGNQKEHVFSVENADGLKHKLKQFVQEACKQPQTLEPNRDMMDILQQNEKIYVQIDLEEGEEMEMALAFTEGEAEAYHSCDEPNPSSAVHDGKFVKGYARIRCPPSRQRRDALSTEQGKARKMAYIGITGVAERNVFTLTALAVPPYVKPPYVNSDWFSKSPHVWFSVNLYNHDIISNAASVYQHVLAHTMFVLVTSLMITLG